MDVPPVAVLITKAVAIELGVGPTELPPLYEFIDPESVDAVAASGHRVYISFEYAGTLVTVEGSQPLSVSVAPITKR